MIAQIAKDGLFILNVQMLGLLIGGILWGVLGDKKGRLKVLFASIILIFVRQHCKWICAKRKSICIGKIYYRHWIGRRTWAPALLWLPNYCLKKKEVLGTSSLQGWALQAQW